MLTPLRNQHFFEFKETTAVHNHTFYAAVSSNLRFQHYFNTAVCTVVKHLVHFLCLF